MEFILWLTADDEAYRSTKEQDYVFLRVCSWLPFFFSDGRIIGYNHNEYRINEVRNKVKTFPFLSLRYGAKSWMQRSPEPFFRVISSNRRKPSEVINQQLIGIVMYSGVVSILNYKMEQADLSLLISLGICEATKCLLGDYSVNYDDKNKISFYYTEQREPIVIEHDQNTNDKVRNSFRMRKLQVNLDALVTQSKSIETPLPITLLRWNSPLKLISTISGCWIISWKDCSILFYDETTGRISLRIILPFGDLPSDITTALVNTNDEGHLFIYFKKHLYKVKHIDTRLFYKRYCITSLDIVSAHRDVIKSDDNKSEDQEDIPSDIYVMNNREHHHTSIILLFSTYYLIITLSDDGQEVDIDPQIQKIPYSSSSLRQYSKSDNTMFFLIHQTKNRNLELNADKTSDSFPATSPESFPNTSFNNLRFCVAPIIIEEDSVDFPLRALKQYEEGDRVFVHSEKRIYALYVPETLPTTLTYVAPTQVNPGAQAILAEAEALLQGYRFSTSATGAARAGASGYRRELLSSSQRPREWSVSYDNSLWERLCQAGTVAGHQRIINDHDTSSPLHSSESEKEEEKSISSPKESWLWSYPLELFYDSQPILLPPSRRSPRIFVEKQENLSTSSRQLTIVDIDWACDSWDVEPSLIQSLMTSITSCHQHYHKHYQSSGDHSQYIHDAGTADLGQPINLSSSSDIWGKEGEASLTTSATTPRSDDGENLFRNIVIKYLLEKPEALPAFVHAMNYLFCLSHPTLSPREVSMKSAEDDEVSPFQESESLRFPRERDCCGSGCVSQVLLELLKSIWKSDSESEELTVSQRKALIVVEVSSSSSGIITATQRLLRWNWWCAAVALCTKFSVINSPRAREFMFLDVSLSANKSQCQLLLKQSFSMTLEVLLLTLVRTQSGHQSSVGKLDDALEILCLHRPIGVDVDDVLQVFKVVSSKEPSKIAIHVLRRCIEALRQ